MARHLQHIRSSQSNKVPDSEKLYYGEIAVNYAKGSERLYIKNTENEIYPFRSFDEDTEMAIAQSLCELDQRILANASKINENSIGLSTLNDEVSQFDFDKLKSTTYSSLVELRDSDELEPGMYYRITDYITTTTQADTVSAGHQFDLVVMALSENTLSERAIAMQHGDDTYFSKCAIESWDIRYTLDNNSSEFEWADEENGKGIIYYMKDEYNNECTYDFKNIKFKKYKINSVIIKDFFDDKEKTISSSILYGNKNPYYAGYVDTYYEQQIIPASVNVPLSTVLGDYDYFYTFNGINIDNVDEYFTLVLADRTDMTPEEIEELEDEIENFVFEYSSYDLTTRYKLTAQKGIGGQPSEAKREIVYGNSIGMSSTVFYGYDSRKLRLPANVFYGTPNGCIATFGGSARWYDDPVKIAFNTINGDSMNNIFIGNSLGNSLEEESHGNVIGLNSSFNKLGASVYNCVLADNVYSNVISSDNYTVNIGSSCRYNEIGGGNNSIILYNNSNSNRIGNYNSITIVCGNSNFLKDNSNNLKVRGNKNNIGSGNSQSEIGAVFEEKPCNKSTIGDDCTALYIVDSSNITVENNTQSLTMPSNSLNVHVYTGGYGLSTLQNMDLSSAKMKFVGINSNDDVVVWNPADHIVPSSTTN